MYESMLAGYSRVIAERLIDLLLILHLNTRQRSYQLLKEIRRKVTGQCTHLI